MSDLLKSSLGDVWVQKESGKVSEWLGSCVDLGDIAEPQGDVTKLQCRNRDGVYESVGETQAAPGAVTTSIKRLEFTDTTILDEIKRCAPNIYVMQRDCGQAGVFANWIKAKVLANARFTTRTYAGLAAREDVESTVSVDISANNPLIRLNEVTVRRQTIAETTDLNDIAFCNQESCGGNCGSAEDLGTDGFLVGDAPAGSPASKADVWDTDDSGNTWLDVAGPHPFAAGEDIVSETCFPMDATTTRWIVARAPSGMGHAQIAYSDNKGASWALVTVGSVDGEGAGDLFSFDRDHIWFATTEGNVYFSEDAGVTWDLQTTAATASGANSLNEVDFADYDNGWAVGDSDTVIRTTDGGDTWEAITSPTSAANVQTVVAFSRHRAEIGASTDAMYQTWDGGVNWTAKTYTGQSTNGTVKGLAFSNDLTGFMIHNPAAGQGYVHRSWDGGHTWKRLDTPANSGLNSVTIIDENTCFVVGNAHTGTGFVAKVSI